jgi:soluble lytic murein transglycosylase
LVLLGLLALGARIKPSPAPAAGDLPRIETDSQLGHSLELLSRGGRSSDYSRFLNGATGIDLRPFLLETVEQSLPLQYRHHAFEIAHAVIAEANHHKMDPFFLLAVIKTESHFNLVAHGSHGEIGLMQILPRTAAWLAPQAGLSSDHLNLEDPSVNIRIGATYFAHLRKMFEGRALRYVGAYNMGATNVRRLLASNTEPRIYAGRVLGNYRKFYKQLTTSYAPAVMLAQQPVREVASLAH